MFSSWNRAKINVEAFILDATFLGRCVWGSYKKILGGEFYFSTDESSSDITDKDSDKNLYF